MICNNRIIRYNLIKKIGVVLVVLINWNIVFGCSCEELEDFDIWDYLDYTCIVKGEILLLEEFPDSPQIESTKNEYLKNGGYQLIKIKVEEVYKGTFSDTMLFKANLSNGVNCAKTFAVGEKWYIFSNTENNEKFIGGCSWSQKAESNPKLIKRTISYIEEISSIEDAVVEKQYFDKECLKKRRVKGRVIKGQADGYWVFLDSKGNPYMTGYYSNGVPDSLWTEYYRDEKEFATEKVFAKTYSSSNGEVYIQFNFEGAIVSGYCESDLGIPNELFNSDEVDYLKTKINKTDKE